MTDTHGMDRDSVHRDCERVRLAFHRLLDTATEAELARRTDDTRWTNKQLLWHMLFGYMVVRALIALTYVFGRLPHSFSRVFAHLLNAGTVPFDLINYAGPCGAAKMYSRRRMGAAFDRIIASLHRHLDGESDAELARGMHYPTRWDPFFKDWMTLADVYRYPAQHFDFHYDQLTLGGS
ncbi:DinB family protein [Streptomyces sp. NPDC093225]|uniref:DinB family protein n=1 Tax=Streptomyces sp. NPDC093225 TaxID=3366034 RepID=UPI003803F44A